MTDELTKEQVANLTASIRRQEQAEIGAFFAWCDRQGIDPKDPQAVGQFWNEIAERMG